MQAQVWASVASLAGVGLGGGLSFLAQLATQRQATRHERQRQSLELAEARRAERLDLLQRFIEATQQAERAAGKREDAPPEWDAEARAAMDGLWICERMIHVLFSAELHERAREYAVALNRVVWEDLPPEVTIAEHLEAPKGAFLDAARAEMG